MDKLGRAPNMDVVFNAVDWLKRQIEDKGLVDADIKYVTAVIEGELRPPSRYIGYEDKLPLIKKKASSERLTTPLA